MKTPFAIPGAWAALFCVVGAGLAASALAAGDLKGVSDPTRPPPGLFRPASGAPVGAPAMGGTAPASASAALAAASAASAASAPAPRALRLQAIRHNGASGGGVAMIDGELVELGGRLAGGWTLSAMNSDEVWITGPAGQRRLTLLGGDTQTDKPRAASGRRARKE